MTASKSSPQNTIASGYAPIHGGQLYFETAGKGPALLLVHAGIADHRMWDDQFALFAERYKTIRFDLRGFGKTETEPVEFSFRQDIYDLLKHLKVERAALIGVSMGGQMVTDFTLEHPEMVTALIPVAAGLSGFESEKGRTDPKSLAEAALIAQMEAHWEKKELKALQELDLQLWVDGPRQPSDRVPAALREKVRTMLAAGDAHVNDGATSQRLDPPAYGRLSEIKAPTLVIVGDLDVTDVLEACDILATQIPGARKAVMPNTAHLPSMEQPAEFNRLVLDFLTGLKN